MKKLRDKFFSPNHSERLPFQQKNSKVNSPSFSALKFDNTAGERIVIPRKKPSENKFAPNKITIHSTNVSRHHIEDQQPKMENIQFAKTSKNHLKCTHHRTRSNQIYLQDQDLSNFSNSLKNISQEVIQIPFKKKRLNTHMESLGKENQDFGEAINFSKRNGSCSAQNRKSQENKNSSVDAKKHKIQRSTSKKSTQLFSVKSSHKSALSFLPKPKRYNDLFPPKILISQFSLKALKITQNGSIIYLAIHKKTSSVYAIKSIRKVSIKGITDQILMQVKLGLLFGHPNFAKIYGCFSDKDNFYIIKEYLDQGCILDHKKYAVDHTASQSLNQVLFAASCLSDILDIRKWSFSPSKIAKTHGIAKITSIDFNPADSTLSSEQLRQTIEWFFQPQDRRSTLEGTLASNNSKVNTLSFMSKNSSSFLQTLNNIFSMNQNAILMLLEHPFLRQARFKSTMQE